MLVVVHCTHNLLHSPTQGFPRRDKSNWKRSFCNNGVRDVEFELTEMLADSCTRITLIQTRTLSTKRGPNPPKRRAVQRCSRPRTSTRHFHNASIWRLNTLPTDPTHLHVFPLRRHCPRQWFRLLPEEHFQKHVFACLCLVVCLFICLFGLFDWMCWCVLVCACWCVLVCV